MNIDLKLVNMQPEEAPVAAIAKKLKEKIKFPCNKILLIHPHQIEEKDFFAEKALRGKYSIYPPYGCGVLARNLLNRGYQPDILDLNFELLSAVRTNGFDYQCWKKILLERLRVFKPDLVGISCMFSMSHDIMKEIAHQVKDYDFDIPIICGGVHISDSKNLILENFPKINFMGIYECDCSFPDLIDFVNNKLSMESLAQVAAIIDGKYVALEARVSPTPEEIDAIPFYCDLPIESYSEFGQIGNYEIFTQNRPVSTLETNRGCRAHCSFCTVPELFGKGIVRLRSIQSTTEEVGILYSRGIRHLEILDDDMLNKPDRIIALLKAISDLKLDLTWSATNGLIASAITENVMEAMVASGCIGFNLGIESGNPQRLKEIHKPSGVRNFIKCKEITDKYPHLFIRGYLIIGFPGETVTEFMDTVNLGLELQFDWYNLQRLNPLPSTEIYNTMVQQGLIQNALNTDKRIYGPNSSLRIQERMEKLTTSEFFDLFNIGKPDDLIKEEHLDDYLFLMSYKLNYEIVFKITNEYKLKNKDMFFADICERMAPESALDQLFYGITRHKFRDKVEAAKRAVKVRELLAQSAYWQKRFEVLDLYPLVDSIS